MNRLSAFFGALVCQVALLGGVALADGAPRAAGAANTQASQQVVFQCKGGVRVLVTRLPGQARVEFAGRTQVLPLATGGGNVRYRSAQFAWVSDGKTAYMQDTRSGQLQVSGCVQAN